MGEYDGKVAIVTGAGSGIGRATALAFARAGAKVLASDVNQASAQETARSIEAAGGEALGFRTDVSRAEDCQAMVALAIEKFGRLDCACNNAGIGGEQARTADLTVEGWHHVIETNLSSAFYCMKYEIPAMLKGGRGAIVNMGSILSAVGLEGAAGYVASKHGMLGLTRTAALEYSSRGIRINAIGPGFIRTPLIAGMEDAVLPLHPIGRLGLPEEVATLVLFLCSDQASFITGSYYPIDGGYLAR
ncbi:MAG TPA: SDR family oxidoreductase [Candidatus Sulfotelmatobacter sp.]|nr:SDR family oxidoreductase [Candidatus Sulfotelmatobacter sp.]